MKISIWDILTGVILLGILCMVGAFGAILMNPSVAFNPLPPPQQQQPGYAPIPTIALPPSTPTLAGLPPTWTPMPTPTEKGVVAGQSATLAPTATPVPTFTPVILPTFTPSRMPPAAHGGGSCSVVSQTPTDGYLAKRGENLNVQWTIKNQSDKIWRSDSIDIRYVGGDSLNAEKTIYDLPYDVSPNAMIQINVKMIAPTTAGAYTSNWSLSAGNTSVCQFYLKITVP